MCGFAYFKVLDGNFDLSLLKDQSLKILAKRGPDDQNYFILKRVENYFVMRALR